MQDFATSFGLDANGEASSYEALLVSMNAAGNILFPGEQTELSLQIVNKADKPILGAAKVEIVHYGTKGIPGDIWKPKVFSMGVVDTVSVPFDIKPKGFANVKITPNVPETLGGYAIVIDIPGQGRRFVSSFVRTFKAIPHKGPFTKLTTDLNDVDVNTRLGVSPNRVGWGYRPTDDPGFEEWYQSEVRKSKFAQLKSGGMGITVEFGHGVAWTGRMQPMGVPRPWLDENGAAKQGSDKPDIAWLPQYDADFKKLVKRVAMEHGYPKGPVIAIKLWNEPWEGLSICHWGADMLRYREIFTAMCEGVEEARKEAGVEVLLGGCDSSSNTIDKLFPDGKDDFLKRLDFMSIHYQGLSPFSTYKPFLNRAGGRVKIWDTESWVANVDDRVATVVSTNFSSGHDRAVGIFGGNISDLQYHNVYQADGTKKEQELRTLWSIAASIGAVQHFVGERDFKQMLFMNGLPWVMVYDGLPNEQGVKNVDDGALVVVGDIGETFTKTATLFWTVSTLAGKTGSMTLNAAGQPFGLFDFYGNAMPAKDGKIVIPLDHRGFYLRTDGSKGSFAKLLEAAKSARIDGFEPVEIVAHDFQAPIETQPTLRLKLTNVLNRPVTGKLAVTLGSLTLQAPAEVKIESNQSKWVDVKVVGGSAEPANTYPLSVTFDAGEDGAKTWKENLHVNMIAKRTIDLDGKLTGWAGVLPQTIIGKGTSTPTLQEVAWLPFKTFDKGAEGGLATAYLAYDDKYFYFAAKIADSTLEAGMRRTDSPEYDESAFYPAKFRIPSTPLKQETLTEMTWPEGVRRYSYRNDPDLPAGNFPNHDNVQIAFNVLQDAEKDMLPNPPGTPYHYTGYQCSDYEYALNPVAEQFGGGTELFRLRKPGMPLKHHYPRQPKSPLDGAVKDGKLLITRDGTTRMVECAIPWSEIPHVKAKLDAGEPIKFSYRVNDNAGGPCMELSRERSVAKRNGSFKVDWVEHWANEVEFGWAK